jgi:hypothetical protein
MDIDPEFQQILLRVMLVGGTLIIAPPACSSPFAPSRRRRNRAAIFAPWWPSSPCWPS